MTPWDQSLAAVLPLPSGRLVRGRGLRDPAPEGPEPHFGLYLQARPTPPLRRPSRWLRWPDWWLPIDREDARTAFKELWERAELERVEVACSGGQGQTGTVLACLAIIDGIPAGEAAPYVRQHYNPRAVETPWQQRYVKHFQP